ncbi:MAG: hypothetical protein ABI656_13570, partial [bacterium]
MTKKIKKNTEKMVMVMVIVTAMVCATAVTAIRTTRTAINFLIRGLPKLHEAAPVWSGFFIG